jgi:hypothetical protein
MPAVTLVVNYPHHAGPTFDAVTAQDVLPKVLPGTRLIPAVVGTTILNGPEWDHPGCRREVHFSDGSMAHEEIVAFTRPTRFEYRVTPHSGPMRWLFRSATGAWDFVDGGPDRTTVSWRYAFTGRSWVTRPALWVFAHVAFRRLMRQCLVLMGPLISQEG